MEEKNLWKIADVFKYLSYVLAAAFVLLVIYILFNSYQEGFDRYYLDTDDQLASVQWEMTVWTWDEQAHIEDLEALSEQNRHSPDEVYEIASLHADLWQVGKSILVIENYLELWEWDVYSNSHFHELAALLYEEICDKDEIAYCREGLRHFVKLYEAWVSELYLQNIANILWRMWDERAEDVLEMYESYEWAQQWVPDQDGEMELDASDLDIEGDAIEFEYEE